MRGLTRENSDIIGFVTKSLSYLAINRAEVSEWAIKMVAENDINELPNYLIDLMDFNDESPDLFKIIGFVPVWKHNKDQLKALYGIAIKRGKSLSDIDITANEALTALEKYSEIEERFRNTFPFIIF